MIISQQQKPLIMGILNVTPDSFSDGGQFNSLAAAINHGKQMFDEGADIIDIGGESTRPGAMPVAAEVQIERVVAIIEAIAATLPKTLIISIDTTLAPVAAAALKAGATMVNDVSAGQDDPAMLALCAEAKCPYVIMHRPGPSATMQDNINYDDVVIDIQQFLKQRSAACLAAGIAADNIIIDPGIGFGKTKQHNLLLLKQLRVFTELGYPLLLGTSRKRFMGSICQANAPAELIGATCATTALGVADGVTIFRVHDVKANRQALDVAYAITHGN